MNIIQEPVVENENLLSGMDRSVTCDKGAVCIKGSVTTAQRRAEEAASEATKEPQEARS